QQLHRMGRTAIVGQRRQHRVRAGLVPGADEARGLGGETEKVMAVAGHGAVDVGSGSRGAAGVAGAVGRGVAGDDRVFQGDAAGAHADAAAGPLGHRGCPPPAPAARGGGGVLPPPGLAPVLAARALFALWGVWCRSAPPLFLGTAPPAPGPPPRGGPRLLLVCPPLPPFPPRAALLAN